MGIDDYAADLIRIKARELVKTAGLPQSEREDVEQELVLDLLGRLSRFDPNRASLRTFVARVVEHGVASLIERRSAQKRDGRRVECSLDELVDDGEGSRVQRAATIEAHAPDVRDLALDLAEVLEGLPPKLRALCEMLPDHTPAQMAEKLGITRRTVSRWVSGLRERFTEAGLDRYFEESMSQFRGASGKYPVEACEARRRDL